MFIQLLNKILIKLLSVKEEKNYQLKNPKSLLIIRQHNQLGDIIAFTPLLRAIKEKFPKTKITVIASPLNYPGLLKNKYIDELFLFNKKKLFNFSYIKQFKSVLKLGYDAAIMPVSVSISFTSCLITRLSKTNIRIGPNSLNGMSNKYAYMFSHRLDMDWRKFPDSNVSDRSLDLLRPFGIDTKNFKAEVTFDNDDLKFAKEFLGPASKKIVIGIHPGAAKVQNIWSLKKFAEVINKLEVKYHPYFFLTCGHKDKEYIAFIKNNCSSINFSVLENESINRIAAVISLCNLFITNDTGIMHVAGATASNQISIFGPTNPYNWAPVGANKYILKKSDLIDDVTVEDVLNLSFKILDNAKPA